MVVEQGRAQRLLARVRRAGRREIDAAERLGAEDQAEDLPVLLGLGEVVDVRNALELGRLRPEAG